MIDILIKSFNRPYYLDRCITSIYQNVEGNFAITVLDDGTPEKYIKRLQSIYPNVKFIFSDWANEKRDAIKNNLITGSPINGFAIPISLWKSEVEKASEYFLLTEDDVWLTETIDLQLLIPVLKNKNIPLLKIGWISNRKIRSEINELTDEIQIIKPKIFTAPKFIMNALFANRFKIFSLLYRLRLVDNYTKSDYWVLNALLIGIYNKEYWLKLWSNLDKKVDEVGQLKNAVQWYRKNKKKANFAKFKSLKMKTTFKTSATGSYHLAGDFDINKFNHLINEAWYNDEFDALNNFPNDISDEEFIKILTKYSDQNFINAWKQWVNHFKIQYIRQQVDVD